jgi:hypothetical protein
VPWDSCDAKHLQEKLDAGQAVVFTVDEENMHAVTSVNVYILGLSIGYRQGSTINKFLRHFTVNLQEAPPS